LKRCVTGIRVRYPEVDRMGVVHHSNFFIWFEIGRTELLRQLGCTYEAMEAEGVFMPVVKASCRYRSPARYDEMLEVETVLEQVSASRVCFDYRLRRPGTGLLLAEATTVHATVNRSGEVIRLPDPYRDLLCPP